jgi:crotonobetainyl-CoA:carnitine CoA-transferase CaiB-like acyl-CoA transferase
VLTDPHLRARNFFVDLPHPTAGMVRHLGSPARLSKTPPKMRAAAPLLGEHTDVVLQELGLSAAEIASLGQTGIVARPPARLQSPA